MYQSFRRRNASVKAFSGFTLVELIVVITILAILATVGFLSLSGYSDDARASALKANVRTVYSAIMAESTTSGNSPRYYVAHDPSAALSGAFVFVEGKAVALTGGDVGQPPTDSNYSAGNPRWDRLRMNGDKFRISARFGFPGAFPEASAAYSATGSVTIGAVDAVGKATLVGKSKQVSYFQVAGVLGGSKSAALVGNYSPTGTNASVGLIRDPYSTGSASAVVEGGLGTSSGDPIAPASCAAIKAANPSATSGTYSVDPDGFGGYAPTKAYCDMATAGGGWTVVASDGSASILQTINTMSGTPSPTVGGILPAFLGLPISRVGSEIRVVSLSDPTKSASFSMTGTWLGDPALKDLEHGYLYDAVDNGFEGGAEGSHKCNFSVMVIDNVGGCTQSLAVSYPANGKALGAIKGNDGSGYGAGAYSWQFQQGGFKYRLGWTVPSGFAAYYNERMPSYLMVR